MDVRDLTRLMVSAAVLAACLGLGACTDDPPRESSPGTSRPSAAPPQAPSPPAAAPAPCAAPAQGQPRPGLDTTVKVFLFCKATGGVMPVELHPADRVVPDDGEPLRSALIQLLLGVTPAEDRAGLGSAFSSSTAGGLRGASVTSGIARLDFTAGFEATTNFSTTNLAGVVFSQIEATVFQFPAIRAVELAIEGRRWCGWEAGDCGPDPMFER